MGRATDGAVYDPPESPESRSLGLSPASLLSVSPTGDLAVSLGWRQVVGWESLGTLARVPLEGGAPREILENVMAADWSPDGKELAVVRDTGVARHLEFPIGKRLYETASWMSHPRVSPDGKLVAIVDNPQRGDNVGRVVVFDSDGKRRLDGAPGGNGIAWSKDGQEIWYATPGSLNATNLSGKRRLVANLITGFTVLHDVARDGRVILSRASWRREIIGLAPGETKERNLTWLDWSFPTALSADGSVVLFDEQNLPTYQAYLRKMDGSPAVLLGKYHSIDLSPDGEWALVADAEQRQLSLLPTGAGQARPIAGGTVVYQGCAFFPDGQRIVAAGSEPGRRSRLYVLALDGWKPRADHAGGSDAPSTSGTVSPDGRTIPALGPDRRIMLYPAEPGEPRPAPGLKPDELPIRWTPDGRAMWVFRKRSAREDLPGGHDERRADALEGTDAARSRRCPHHGSDRHDPRREILRVLVPPDAGRTGSRGGAAVGACLGGKESDILTDWESLDIKVPKSTLGSALDINSHRSRG